MSRNFQITCICKVFHRWSPLFPTIIHVLPTILLDQPTTQVAKMLIYPHFDSALLFSINTKNPLSGIFYKLTKREKLYALVHCAFADDVFGFFAHCFHGIQFMWKNIKDFLIWAQEDLT